MCPAMQGTSIILGTSKNRFEKGKCVECAECDESRRSKAVCLTRRCNTMLQSEITGDGMDAVASEISLVERSRRCAIHIFTQTRFLEVTITY